MAQAQKAIRLGDWLLDRSVVTQTQLDLALREQKRKGWLLGEALAQLGFVTQETLSQFLAQKTQTESVDLAAITIPPEMVKLVPEQLARRLVAVPVSREGDLIDLGVMHSIIEKSGSWLSYKGERIGQGRENARQFLKDNTGTRQTIETELRKALGLIREAANAGPQAAPAAGAGAAAPGPKVVPAAAPRGR